VDASGNTVVVGWFSGTVTFGGPNLTSDSGSDDIFLVKYGPNGVHLWSQRFGSTGDDTPWAVAVDDSGNIIVTGYFHGTVDFGGGGLVSAGNKDIFLAKYYANGAHQWSQRLGGTDNESSFGVAVDGSGNILVAGSFSGAVNLGGSDLVSAGAGDVFIAKYNAGGAHQWSERFGGTGEDEANAVAVDVSGNVVVTGYFDGTTNLGGANLVSAGNKDIFLAKYDANGLHQWSQSFGGTDYDQGNGVAVDNLGNVVVTGLFYSNSINFGGGVFSPWGYDDIFLAKFNASGAHQWSQRFGGTGEDGGSAVAVDNAGYILVTGAFDGEEMPVSFGGSAWGSAPGTYGMFVAKYKPSGAHFYSRGYGGTSGGTVGTAIAADGKLGAVVAGAFSGTTDLGGGNQFSNGYDDVFVAKYGNGTKIDFIHDHPFDQGLTVKIHFLKSAHDSPGVDPQVTQYEALRRNISPAGPPWVSVGQIPATLADEYEMPAGTDADSTCGSGQHYSYYFIRAETSDPGVFFDSPIDSGYSVDNLAPGTPTNLTYASGQLMWDPSSAPDFDHFSIYGNSTNSFGSATLITNTVMTTWPMAPPLYNYYFVTASDHSCNEGNAASVGTVTGVGDTPALTELQVLPNHPNPFNSSTQLNVGLPKASDVRVDVYDVAGRRVRTLTERAVPSGWRQIPFAPRDDSGRPLASGVYFYRVRAAGTTITRRMVIVH